MRRKVVAKRNGVIVRLVKHRVYLPTFKFYAAPFALRKGLAVESKRGDEQTLN